jgi:hypothetical protein
MRRIVGLTMVLASGCLAVPERIIDENPPLADAGSAADAGVIQWSVLPASGSLFGASADINGDLEGFQIELSIQGLADTEFGIYDGEALLAAGQTDAQGVASLELTLEHGAYEWVFRAQDQGIDYRLNVDLLGPTFELDAQPEPARLPWLVWSDESDADGVGSDDVASLELRVNDGDFEPITERLGGDGGGRLRGLNPGAHTLTVRATDTLGNERLIERQVTVQMTSKTVAQSDRYSVTSIPCVGDANGDGLDDLVILRGFLLGSLLVNSGTLVFGQSNLENTEIEGFTLMGRNQSICRFVPQQDSASELLIVGTTGSGSDERFDFIEWSQRAGEMRTQHVMTRGNQSTGSVGLNIAHHPGGLAPLEGARQPRSAIVVQVGDQFLRLFDPQRLDQDSPSLIDAAAPNSLVLRTTDSLAARTVLSGRFSEGATTGLAIVDRRADNNHGAIWVLQTPLASGQSYALINNDNDSPNNPLLRGEEPGSIGQYPQAIKLAPDQPDGILTTTAGRRQLIIHRLDGAPVSITVPGSVGLISGLAACDLNGDGRDEISVVGGLRHEIRWGDGEWTASRIANRPKHTVCAGDMSGDEVNDLVVTTHDDDHSVYVLH